MSTWSGIDYKLLVDLIHKIISPHALHQQQCENHVQVAALTASSNVGEDRHSDRATALSYIMIRFNWCAADEVNTAHKERGKTSIGRVEGRPRMHMFAEYCDAFNTRAKEARADVGDKKYQRLVE